MGEKLTQSQFTCSLIAETASLVMWGPKHPQTLDPTGQAGNEQVIIPSV